MFRDYRSTVDDLRKCVKQNKNGRDVIKRLGIDIDSYESIYRAEMKKASSLKDPFCKLRLRSELAWYKCRRPFFNVYPVIEQKLLSISDEIDISELYLPFPTIEIRTKNRTMLLSCDDFVFMFTVELKNGEYQEFCMAKRGRVKQIESAEYRENVETDWPIKGTSKGLSDDDRRQCAMLVCGVCLLAKDESIVVPVVLNRDRKEEMTEDELRKYAERAAETTGKTGFEVGREMQLNQKSCHYRNGCFAKYYVSKTHQQFPDNCDLEKAPIIKWRSGAVVNASNAPKVPTGFKGNESEFN
jgi:hypothetical protein